MEMQRNVQDTSGCGRRQVWSGMVTGTSGTGFCALDGTWGT
ncbi:MAG TPA: hypothetical protein PK445_02185 [Methanolinea sp.]|nr:hypothetical protein [Methanolinea sp.]